MYTPVTPADTRYILMMCKDPKAKPIAQDPMLVDTLTRVLNETHHKLSPQCTVEKTAPKTPSKHSSKPLATSIPQKQNISSTSSSPPSHTSNTAQIRSKAKEVDPDLFDITKLLVQQSISTANLPRATPTGIALIFYEKVWATVHVTQRGKCASAVKMMTVTAATSALGCTKSFGVLCALGAAFTLDAINDTRRSCS